MTRVIGPWKRLRSVLQAACDLFSSKAQQCCVLCYKWPALFTLKHKQSRIWGIHLVAFKAQPQHLYGVLGRCIVHDQPDAHWVCHAPQVHL